MRYRFWLGSVLCLAVAGGAAAVAQRNASNSKAVKGGDAAKDPPATNRPMALTPAREAAAVTFARINHPELAGLLGRLKKRNKAAYRRALRQLYRDSERLARMKERLPAERYELALNAWKLDSRIRLLAARVATLPRPDPELQAQLKEALLEQVDLRIRQMESDRQRLLQRIRKMDATIAKLRADRDEAADQHLQRVKRSLGLKKKRRPKRKAAPKRRRPNSKNRPTPRKDDRKAK